MKAASFFASLVAGVIYTLFLAASHNQVAADDQFLWVPNQDLKVQLFDYSITKRQNFCALQDQIDAGQLELRDALNGLNLNVALLLDDKYVTYDEDGNIDSRDPGLVVEILDEASKRAGFTWQNSFASVSKDEFRAWTGEETWTDFLMWTISTYDVSINWWSSTPERLTKGAVYPRGWYEGSFIIVSKLEAFFKSEFSALSWMRPFTGNVWLGIVLTLFITGIIALFVEGRSFHDLSKMAPFKGNYISLIVSYVYQMFLVVTGHLDVMTRTHAGQVVSFSICLFCLFIVSTYTANLASFLVIQKAASTEQVNSVGDIVKFGKSICVYGDTAANAAIRDQYPTASIVKRSDERDVMIGLNEAECDYGVMSLAAYELFRGQIDVNGDCDLMRIGRNFRDLEDGFATLSDAGTMCTSLVRDVLNIHLQDMHNDEFIDKAWSRYYSDKHNVDDAACYDDSSAGNKSTATKTTLDFLNLGGIFLLHGALLIVAILVYFWESCMRKTGKKKDHSFDNGGRLTARRHPERLNSMDMLQNDKLTKDMDQLSKKVDDMARSLDRITRILEKSNGFDNDNDNDNDLSVAESFMDNPNLNESIRNPASIQSYRRSRHVQSERPKSRASSEHRNPKEATTPDKVDMSCGVIDLSIITKV